MRKALSIVSAILLAFTLAGCSGTSESKVMKKFSSSEIVFPSSLERVEGAADRHPDLSVPAVRFVIYVDSTQCSSCNINRMPYYTSYARYDEMYPDFQMVAIIWPNAETRETMAANIAHRAFPFDIFIDWDGSFAEANPSIPKKRDYHCFLLGKDSRPIIAGDPVSSKGKEMLLNKTLYDIYGRK